MSSLRARSSAVFDVLSPPLVLVTPFISFINHSGYSYTAPEFWISITILGAIGLLCGTVMMLGPAWVRVLGTAALITLFVDLQFEWFDVQREFRVPALGIGALLLCWLLRDHLSRIVVPVFATMLVANLVFPDRPAYPSFQRLDLNAGASPMPRDAPPPLVHLILDEFIGIEGIPSETAQGRVVRDGLRTFLLDNGFRVFGGAYSRYVRTKDAVPNALNYVSVPENAYFVEGDEPYSLRKNKYLSDMYEQGYRIHVYQSDYIDFCSGYEALIVSCLTLPSRSIEPLPTLPLSSLLKAELMLRTFVSLSVLEHELAHYYTQLRRKALSLGYDLPSWWLSDTKLGTAGAMQLLDAVARDVRKARAGDLFFAHIMLAHSPYVYDRTCRLRNPHDWVDRSVGFGIENTPESRMRRYALYLDQIACVQAKLQQMFDSWRRAGVYDRMKIVIHGDHGSRIYMNAPIVANKDRLIASDYIDSFSTLFAVKAPGLDPAYDTRMVAIQDLLEVVANDSLDRLPADPTQPYVLLPRNFSTTRHAMIVRPMPEPACTATQRRRCALQTPTGGR